jgi:hypothetical protein
MSDKNFQNEEILSGDDEKVRQMLGDLKRVDAPKDFDFRLKARIAASGGKDFEPRLFPALRIAAPLALVLAVLAFFVVSGIYSVDNNSVPQIAGGDIPIPNINKDKPREEFVAVSNSQPENSEQNSGETDKPKDQELAANPDKLKKDAAQAENNGGGSRDSTATEPNVVLPGGFGSKTSLKVKAVLQIMGIEAVFSNKKWKVESVAPNSRAMRAGVKTGDTIEAINDVKLPAETININGPFVGNSLTVVRGSEKIAINLQTQ